MSWCVTVWRNDDGGEVITYDAPDGWTYLHGLLPVFRAISDGHGYVRIAVTETFEPMDTSQTGRQLGTFSIAPSKALLTALAWCVAEADKRP